MRKIEEDNTDINIRVLRRRVNLGLMTIFIGAAVINVAALIFPPDNQRENLHLAASIFCIYIFIECRYYVIRSDAFGLLAPPFLASFAFAFLAFIFPVTVSVFNPEVLFRFESLFSSQGTQLSEAIVYVAIANFAMWRGYRVGLPLAKKLRVALTKAKWIRMNWKPNVLALYVMQFIFLVLVVVSINLGVFGIASSEMARKNNGQIVELLNYGISGGSLSLMLLFIVYFTRRANSIRSLGLQLICLTLLGMHLIIGALSGFKSQLVMPFVMLYMAQFLATRKTNMKYVAMGAGALLVAYLVIEPYRAYLNEYNIRGQSGVGELSNAFQKSIVSSREYSVGEESVFSQISSRFDLTLMTALGLQAADAGIVNQDLVNKMAESVYLSPILAYIPRLIWPTKDTYSSGGWFNQLVIGNTGDTGTSVGMGPVAFMYFLAGSFGVIVGFFIIGFIQVLIFDGIARIGAGGVVIYMATIGTLVFLPSDVGPALTGLMRLIPILFIMQMILLSKK